MKKYKQNSFLAIIFFLSQGLFNMSCSALIPYQTYHKGTMDNHTKRDTIIKDCLSYRFLPYWDTAIATSSAIYFLAVAANGGLYNEETKSDRYGETEKEEKFNKFMIIPVANVLIYGVSGIMGFEEIKKCEEDFFGGQDILETKNYFPKKPNPLSLNFDKKSKE